MARLSVPARLALSVLAVVAVLGVFAPAAWSQASVQGQWSTMPTAMPINPIHAALMYNGKIFVVTGSGNCPPSQSGCPSGPPYGPGNGSGALVFDPTNGNISQFNSPFDMFCNGMVALSDGRLFINGGSQQYDPFLGELRSSIFDPSNNSFSSVSNMAHGRWYPTLTNLSDGRLMTFSGQNETTAATNNAVEIYTIGSGWSSQYVAPWTPPLYPRMHLLPNGKVFYSGSSTTSMLFDPNAHTWSTMDSTIYSGSRTYGSSVLLPLTPDNGYDPQVIIMGGGNPATRTTEHIDLGSGSPVWKSGPNMSQARTEMNAVLLPSGKILALGGSVNDEDATTASLNADLYDPDSDSFSSAGANSYARMYHSVALLLPDATVWVAGGNPFRGSYEQHMEIYKPAYLFNSGGGAATRPTISSLPSAISWNGSFTVSTPDASNISSVVLMRPGASTHSFDMEQRLVGLSFTAGSGSLTVTAPPNGNIAPPGYYMLFILNNNGVPSVAKFTKLSGSGSAPAPTVSSINPSSGSSNGGTAVTITGTGFQSGATVKIGGTSATSVNAQSSTSITATTPSHSPGAGSVVVTNPDSQSGTLSNGYTFTNPAPAVTSINPNSGTISGGTSVTISGTGFQSGATVSIGGTAATGVNAQSSTSITATTAAHSTGTVSVVVTNTDGQSGTLNNGFSYVVINPAPAVTSVSPTSGLLTGGTAVTITGTGFLTGATATFGGTTATNVTVASSTSITATTPVHATGAVSIVVTNTDGKSGTLASGYTYTNPPPTVASISPAAGTANGGTAVTITGTGFLTGAAVSLGGTAATGVTVVSSTSITATSAVHPSGAVNVLVANTDSQSATLTNGYTYTSSLGLELSPGDPSVATVSAGQTASYTLALGGAGMTGSANLTCTGTPSMPAGVTCSVPPKQSFTANTLSPFAVTVTTTPRTVSALQAPASAPAPWSWTLAVSMLGIVGLPGIRVPKRSMRRYLWLVPLALSMLLASCGGGGGMGGSSSSGPQGNANGTPAGTYTLSVTATSTSGSPTQTIPLTLIVQ